MSLNHEAHREPTSLQAWTPIVILMAMLSASVYLFSDDSSYGPNQIALIICAGIAALIGYTNGFKWKEIEQGIIKSISVAMGAMMILLVVGALIGTWILSGIVPTMIYYGLKLLSPTFFYPLAAIICAIVALATGSSWTTASTVGIALVGIALALGLHPGIAAGAIISGSYLGDKLSPLSDTTNLAPAVAGTDLITHIRHMLYTTLPSFTIAITLFFFIGLFGAQSGEMNQLQPFLQALESNFNISLILLLPPVAVIAMVVKRVPPMPALLVGALLGGIFAVFFQQDAVLKYVGETDNARWVALLKGFWMAMFSEYQSTTGNAEIDSLLSRGGMASMLNTIWLILSAMMFGGAMERTGMLEKISRSILSLARSTGSLIMATVMTAIGMNIVAADQYIAIVLPGRMYRAEFRKRGLKPKNLSRALEDSGTLTSPLIPWNTCGAYMASVLGVPTFVYLPFCFFNLMNPLISIFYGYTGFSIEKFDPAEEAEEEASAEASA